MGSQSRRPYDLVTSLPQQFGQHLADHMVILEDQHGGHDRA